jgi:DNA mismatch endonuclease (patch repair protein)
VDVLKPAQRSFNMSRIRARDSKAELIVRRLLFAAGYRYRLHGRKLPGRPDIILPKWGVIVFVHGCFWHSHGCLRGQRPRTHAEFWQRKLDRNQERDAAVVNRLIESGWRVLVIWECRVRGKAKLDPEILFSRCKKFIEADQFVIGEI